MTGMASRYSYGGTYGGVFHFSDYRFVNRRRKNAFFGVKGKIRSFRLKRKPRGEILERILKTYGERIFYNDFDRFLTKNDVICNIIRNCTNVLAFDYKSQSQLVILLCSTICGGTPHYARYYYEFRAIIQYYFEIVFNSLNRIPDENARVICNVAKELANGLNGGLEEIKDKLDVIDIRISTGADSCDETPHFDSAKYIGVKT